MPDEIVVVCSPSTQIEIAEIGTQGPPGPPGDSLLPNPATLADGRFISTLGGAYIDIPAPAGSGDMQSLVYDPAGRSTNVFDLANLTGKLDGGIFT